MILVAVSVNFKISDRFSRFCSQYIFEHYASKLSV